MSIRAALMSALRPFFERRPVAETLSPPDPERKPNLEPLVRTLTEALAQKTAEDDMRRREIHEFADELREASLMGGSGPWLGPMTFAEAAQPGGIAKAAAGGIQARESFANSQGANGLFELELNNWEWRREINFGWLEFSRWGIQQIILLSRLYYIKNPIVRRLVDVCAIYVFGRGMEISSPDPDANDAIKAFIERNQKVLGQAALTDLERRKDYDGNLFFAFFTDPATGETDVRTIDATEMQEIVTDPEDSDTEQLFKRQWFERTFVTQTGMFETQGRAAWYPALGYEPEVKDAVIGGHPVMWDIPVYHRKCGTAGKWLFGCPRIYPMLDWAKAARKFLEACAAVKAALAQISMTITTKGGQQALEGVKQQLQSTVATGNSSWYEQNPTAVNGSIFASGPGTALAAFKSQGQGGDPEEVRRYLLMCCMVKGVPETFLADVSTGNLATATSLDRPTELAFMSLQEEWREDLVVMVRFALRNSLTAPNGRVREAMQNRGADLAALHIREAARHQKADGVWVYTEAPVKKSKPDALEITVTFPAIRESDIPALVTATTAAMTLGQANGVVGIDQKAGILHMMTLLGIEKAQEIVEAMFPETDYDPDRTEQLAAEKEKALNPPEPPPTVAPPLPGAPAKPKTVEAAVERLAEALARWTGSKNYLPLTEGWVTINGAHVFINPQGIVSKGPAAFVGKSHKSLIAGLSHRGGTKAEQHIAEETEVELALGLRMDKSPNNKPFDLTTKEVGVEVKTMTSGANDKITMKAEAVARKDASMKALKLKRAYTVVVDKRPSGVGTSTGSTRYFVKEGYGSFRVGSMTEVKGISGLKGFIKV